MILQQKFIGQNNFSTKNIFIHTVSEEMILQQTKFDQNKIFDQKNYSTKTFFDQNFFHLNFFHQNDDATKNFDQKMF